MLRLEDMCNISIVLRFSEMNTGGQTWVRHGNITQISTGYESRGSRRKHLSNEVSFLAGEAGQ